MERILGTFGELKDPRLDSGDSFVDKVNSRFTVSLFFGLSLFVTWKQHYVGSPISCFHPTHFTKSHRMYADAICWVNNTYFVPFDTEIPKAGEERYVIGYYQWTSLIISAQAILFYIPRLIWMTFNKKSGIEVVTITGAAVDVLRSSDSDFRHRTIRYICNHLGRFLGEIRGQLRLSSTLRSFWWRLYGDYLALLYMMVKVLYLANVYCQLFLLDKMLGIDIQDLHGITFLRHLLYDSRNVISPLFPRVAFCDFKTRLLGNTHRYTIQCALPINLFNEKIFILIWFWMFALCIMTSISFIWWIWCLLYYPTHVHYVKTKLMTHEMGNTRVEHCDIVKFVRGYLRRDGVIIINFIASNTSDMIATEVVVGLWDIFQKQEKEQRCIRRRERFASDYVPRNLGHKLGRGKSTKKLNKKLAVIEEDSDSND